MPAGRHLRQPLRTATVCESVSRVPVGVGASSQRSRSCPTCIEQARPVGPRHDGRRALAAVAAGHHQRDRTEHGQAARRIEGGPLRSSSGSVNAAHTDSGGCARSFTNTSVKRPSSLRTLASPVGWGGSYRGLGGHRLGPFLAPPCVRGGGRARRDSGATGGDRARATHRARGTARPQLVHPPLRVHPALPQPPSRSTRRCFEMVGCGSPSAASISCTERSVSSSSPTIARRLGSARVANVDSISGICLNAHIRSSAPIDGARKAGPVRA